MNLNLIEPHLIELRHALHRNPELSGFESETAARITEFAGRFSGCKIISSIGGNGVAVVFEGSGVGNTVLIRCELDALPIPEVNNFEHRSVSNTASHKCGHDGHMAIVSGLIPLLSEGISKGRVVLLFQPAEETGEGALGVLGDSRFREIKPDYVFALHNLPGFKKHQIIIKENVFASASKGLIIKLTGRTSHAAEPEKGVTPSPAVAELINKVAEIPLNGKLNDFALVTIVHAKIGERAFGTTPGYAELMATVRSYNSKDMDTITGLSEELVKSVSGRYNLKYQVEWVEEFPSTMNTKECVEIIRSAAVENNYSINEIDEPFRWSEDFGHFTMSYKGALFGIGSGINHPELHNPDYDFPDEIILTGVKMFYSIIKELTE